MLLRKQRVGQAMLAVMVVTTATCWKTQQVYYKSISAQKRDSYCSRPTAVYKYYYQSWAVDSAFRLSMRMTTRGRLWNADADETMTNLPQAFLYFQFVAYPTAKGIISRSDDKPDPVEGFFHEGSFTLDDRNRLF
jgi:hypothetical protein